MKDNNQLRYRPDIDGLRAIAVLLVIIYHARYGVITGGYIGVDVFFVISGFLITAIVIGDIQSGIFTYRNFYLRRIRRIIPVLVLVLIVTTIPTAVLFFSDDFERHSRLLLYTFFSAANFHLWITGENYFSPNTDLVPLLHVWSLSVEEQFYFIWPACLVIAHALLKHKHVILFIIFFTSLFILSIWMSDHKPLAAYYLLPARAFELMMGAGLALYWKAIPDLPKNINHLLSLVAISLIIGASVLLTKTSQFPGINAFWPCLGTALLIITGKNPEKSGIVNQLLCLKPVVFIGLISYSLYLWHWPVFVFVTYTGLDLTGATRIAAIATIFLLSYLSWKFVEVPFHRNIKWSFKQTMQRIMLTSFIAITVIYAVIDGYDGFPERFTGLTEFNKDLNFPNRVRAACFDKYRIGNIDQCSLGIKKSKLDGVLIGDSYGNHTAAFLDVLAKDAGLFIHDSTAGAYPLLARRFENGRYDKPPEYGIERLKYAKQFKNIFIAANWDIYASPENLNYEPILKTVEELVTEGIRVVIFSNLRATSKANLHQLKLFKTRDNVYFDNRDFSIPYTKRPDDFIVTEMKRRYPSVIVVDPNKVMCDETHCGLEIEGTLIYRSNDHITTNGGTLLGNKYLQSEGNPLRQLSGQFK